MSLSEEKTERSQPWGGAEVAGAVFVVTLLIVFTAAYTGLLRP